MKAVIQDAKIRLINKVWPKHKPQGLGFSDNDVIILTLKTNDGQTFTQSFYCRLKSKGSISHSITKASEKRQMELQRFIQKYISKDKMYSIRDNIDSWKGKEVEVEKISGAYVIKR